MEVGFREFPCPASIKHGWHDNDIVSKGLRPVRGKKRAFLALFQPISPETSHSTTRPQGTLHLSELGLPDQPFQIYIHYATPLVNVMSSDLSSGSLLCRCIDKIALCLCRGDTNAGSSDIVSMGIFRPEHPCLELSRKTQKRIHHCNEKSRRKDRSLLDIRLSWEAVRTYVIDLHNATGVCVSVFD